MSAQAVLSIDAITQGADTTILKKKTAVDSIKLKRDKFFKKAHIESVEAYQTIDSLGSKVTSVPQKRINQIDSTSLKIENATSNYTDSINSLFTFYHSKLYLDRLTSRIDSLKEIGQSYEKYSSKLDSMTNLQSLNSKAMSKPISKVTQTQTKVSELQSKSKNGIDEKLQVLSKETGGKANIPSGIPSNELTTDLNIPSLNTSSNSDLNLKTSLPSIDTPSLSTPQAGIKNSDLSDKLTLKNSIGERVDTDKLGEVKRGSDEVSKISSKVTGYSEDIKNIKEGKIEKAENIQKDAIAKLPVNDEMKVLHKQEELVNSQKEEINSLGNPDEYKKQAQARARKMVMLQMASQEIKIQESVDKLSKYQQKATSVLNKKSDLPKKRDALRKVKKHERFVPGLTLQIQKTNGWLIDVNPSLRYRLTVYWSVGAGWSERIDFGDHVKSYSKGRVFGPRAFSEVVLFKGFSFRFDVEDRNLFVAPSPNFSIDTGRRLWIWNYMAGIKKEFSFVPGVIGNAQFMYNLYSSSHAKIYPTRFNVRVGFEFPFSRKTKSVK